MSPGGRVLHCLLCLLSITSQAGDPGLQDGCHHNWRTTSLLVTSRREFYSIASGVNQLVLPGSFSKGPLPSLSHSGSVPIPVTCFVPRAECAGWFSSVGTHPCCSPKIHGIPKLPCLVFQGTVSDRRAGAEKRWSWSLVSLWIQRNEWI